MSNGKKYGPLLFDDFKTDVEEASRAFSDAFGYTSKRRWVGQNNWRGRLRYKYYEKRGWIFQWGRELIYIKKGKRK